VVLSGEAANLAGMDVDAKSAKVTDKQRRRRTRPAASNTLLAHYPQGLPLTPACPGIKLTGVANLFARIVKLLTPKRRWAVAGQREAFDQPEQLHSLQARSDKLPCPARNPAWKICSS
jgi:hypothetical protein